MTFIHSSNECKVSKAIYFCPVDVSIDERSGSRRHHYQQLACCLGTFCVILVLGIIAVTVYRKYEKDQSIHTLTLELRQILKPFFLKQLNSHT